MFQDDDKIIQRMAPLLKRVLIVDPQPASVRLVGDLMRSLTQCQVWSAPSTSKGLELADRVDPHIIFVELSGPSVDGIEFTRRLRRSEYACRQAPVVAVTATATAAAILGARDAGVHEFLRKPFTMKDLVRRLEAVTLKPRDWIEAVHYVGPDRRRFNSGDYSGPRKRRSDARATPDAARITQALKIMRSAANALDSDRLQAMRALRAQAVDLQKAAVAVSDLRLSTATADFQRYLAQLGDPAKANPAEIAAQVGGLLKFLPAETGPKRAA